MTAVAAIHADMRRMTADVTTPSDRLRRNPELIVKGGPSRREPFVAGHKALSAGPPGEAEALSRDHHRPRPARFEAETCLYLSALTAPPEPHAN